MLGVTFLIIVGIRSVSMSIQIDDFQICIYTDIIEINVARKIKHSFETIIYAVLKQTKIVLSKLLVSVSVSAVTSKYWACAMGKYISVGPLGSQ